MPTTKLYRIALIVVNLGTVALGALTAYGPGFGLSLPQIGMITTGLNLLIVLARQVGDPSTPTLSGK